MNVERNDNLFLNMKAKTTKPQFKDSFIKNTSFADSLKYKENNYENKSSYDSFNEKSGRDLLKESDNYNYDRNNQSQKDNQKINNENKSENGDEENNNVDDEKKNKKKVAVKPIKDVKIAETAEPIKDVKVAGTAEPIKDVKNTGITANKKIKLDDVIEEDQTNEIPKELKEKIANISKETVAKADNKTETITKTETLVANEKGVDDKTNNKNINANKLDAKDGVTIKNISYEAGSEDKEKQGNRENFSSQEGQTLQNKNVVSGKKYVNPATKSNETVEETEEKTETSKTSKIEESIEKKIGIKANSNPKIASKFIPKSNNSVPSKGDLNIGVNFDTQVASKLIKTSGNIQTIANPESFMKEIVAKVQSIQTDLASNVAGGEKMKMDLNIKSLGNLQMSLQQKDGAIKIALEVGNDSSKEQLMQQREELEKHIRALGYTDVSVDVSTSDENQDFKDQLQSGNEDIENVKLAGDDNADLNKMWDIRF